MSARGSSGLGTGLGVVGLLALLGLTGAVAWYDASGRDDVTLPDQASFTGSPRRDTSIPRAYTIPDATPTDLFDVTLPDNSGCQAVLAYKYAVFSRTAGATHSGIYIYSFTAVNGVITGSASDSLETVNGTGCDAGCDAPSVGVSGATATGRVTFDNTLQRPGSLTFRLLSCDCATFVDKVVY